MKRIAVTWTETTTYEAVIDVPDDYPETADDYDDREHAEAGIAPSLSGESDWWERVEAQVLDWPNACCQSNERELTNIERITAEKETT